MPFILALVWPDRLFSKDKGSSCVSHRAAALVPVNWVYLFVSLFWNKEYRRVPYLLYGFSSRQIIFAFLQLFVYFQANQPDAENDKIALLISLLRAIYDQRQRLHKHNFPGVDLNVSNLASFTWRSNIIIGSERFKCVILCIVHTLNR